MTCPIRYRVGSHYASDGSMPAVSDRWVKMRAGVCGGAIKSVVVASIGVALLAIGWAVPAPSDAGVVESVLTWQARINRTVHRAHHWSWILRRLERRDDKLIVGLAFKNNGTHKRPIFLDANFMNSSVLTGNDQNRTYGLISVDGISAERSAVNRRSTRETVFIFDYPRDANNVRFTSRWVTMLMANGAATIIDVAFRLQIPPPEAALNR